MNHVPSSADELQSLEEAHIDYLLPQQRLALIAEVLATIAVRMAKEHSDT